ncbi:MAG: uracil DNA glycosylase [Trichoglossum hirsutum]|nr:MAG: uracil DNA glycosylase [Trichoglossum hirsutum]
MSRKNTALSTPTKIHLPVDELLRQTVRYLAGSVLPVVSIDGETVASHAVETAAKALQNNHRTVVFTEPPSKAIRAAARKFALAPPPSNPLAIRTNTDTPLPDPLPLTTKQRDALRKLALETVLPPNVPYIFTLRPRLAEAYLPSLTGTLVLTGLDSDDRSPAASVTMNKIYFDTGAHISVVSDDLVTEEFRQYLRLEENAPYLQGNGSRVQVSASLRFSNGHITMAFIILVVPLDEMPNRFSGVLLGQRTFIDRLQFEMIPRNLLIAREQNIPDRIWGDILIKAFIDLDAEVHEF